MMLEIGSLVKLKYEFDIYLVLQCDVIYAKDLMIVIEYLEYDIVTIWHSNLERTVNFCEGDLEEVK